MKERLVLLGTKGGPAIRPLPHGGSGPWPTSSLLEIGGRRIIIDCGLGVTRGLVDAGVRLAELDLIFITHLHSDHVLELGPLIHTAWTAGLKTPVTVHGPAGTADYFAGFLASMRFDIELRIADEGRPDLPDLICIIEFSEGAVLEEDGLSVRALRVDHPPVTDCFALRFETDDTRIVFSADTAYFAPLATFARGADILVHEAMLAAGVDRLVARTGNGDRLKQHLMASHTMAEDAGRIATMADVGHLVLHHLIPADDPEFSEADWLAAVAETWDGRITIGQDGLEIALPAAKAEIGRESA
ncbi:MBL fold metallo-hydrolase [Georhizobium profundi]|uniref:MBL fold metallo-hydrolase n=1 Tax=Georhizobium profundi TaxID=2341112 RepID=A0A3S9B3Z9_9HYPH|nr:MBL fold metallo-hydrolase [Georhizobium profundi]AZN71653.1 MBL fold metallo-hydrolase [Georhizobium profundi]